MKLLLHHTSNPDVDGGYWQAPTSPKRTIADVPNLGAARREFERWRDANGLGGGNLTRRCGEVRDDAGTVLGRFSYNGRFWGPDGQEVAIDEPIAEFNPHCSAHVGTLHIALPDGETEHVPTGYNAWGVCFEDAAYCAADLLGEKAYAAFESAIIDAMRAGSAAGESHGLRWTFTDERQHPTDARGFLDAIANLHVSSVSR